MNVDVILESRLDPRELESLGQIAERSGLNGVWVSSLLDSRDPFANMVPLAMGTSRIHLGPIAVNPYDMHPVRIATSLLTLNQFARGRARIVVGGGGEALQGLGIEPERRVLAVRECVNILRQSFSGDPMDYQGHMFTARGCQFDWADAPDPQLWIGANMPQMLRMAAECADGIMLSDMPPALAARAVGTATGARGTSLPQAELLFSNFTAWHVYPDRTAARGEARRWLLLRGLFRPWVLETFLDAGDVDLVMNSQPAFLKAFREKTGNVEGVPDAILDALVDHLTLTGSPDRLEPLVQKLRNLRDAGVNHLALRLYSEPESGIRILAEELIPRLH